MNTKEETKNSNQKKGEGRVLKGVVVSDSSDKTVTVLVKRFVKHPKYGKYMNKSKRYKAHDESNKFKKGDAITIRECRPVSKDKRFKVITE